MITCANCGRTIEGEIIVPMEWGDLPFCSWKCVGRKSNIRKKSYVNR